MKRNKILTFILGIAILSGIACSSLVIAHGIRAGSVYSQNSSSIRKERFPNPWELQKTKLEEFKEISINLSYCSLAILPGDGYYLEYRMDGTCEEPQYGVSNGKFHFQEGNTQVKYRMNFHFFFNPYYSSASRDPYFVNLYVPREQYFDLLALSSESGDMQIGELNTQNAKINLEYGSLEMDEFSGNKLSIDVDSGNLKLNSITCDNLDISNEYGDLSADSFQISRKASIALDSGSLSISRLNAESLSLSNEYGDCSVHETNVKDCQISMDSGNLTLENAVLGAARIKNSYGHVALDLSGSASDYNYDLNAEYGSITLDCKSLKEDENDEIHYQKDNGKDSTICIDCESGNIDIH